MRWSESVTLEFVKIYLRNECLWNPVHPGYKLKNQRENSYSDIIAEFKASTAKTLSIPEVKMKIKNLRTTYVQQVHKILQKSNPDSIYEPSLIWFHEMDRCLKHLVNNRQPPVYNIAQDIPEVDSSSQLWTEPELQTVSIEDLNSNPPIPQTNPECEHTELPTKKKKKKHLTPGHKKNKKKKNRNKVPIQDNATDSTSENVLKEDEFDIYGKFIASQLRRMDLHKALRLQLAIQNLVGEARISDI